MVPKNNFGVCVCLILKDFLRPVICARESTFPGTNDMTLLFERKEISEHS